MAQNTKDLEREAEQQRAELRNAAEELRRRLTPDSLASTGIDYLRGPGGDRLLRAVQKNPVAAVLAAAGIGWLLYTASQQDEHPTGSYTVGGRDANLAPGGGVSPSSPAYGAGRPGTMGDGTQAQNLNQTGRPGDRITESEVKDAFGTGTTTPRT